MGLMNRPTKSKDTTKYGIRKKKKKLRLSGAKENTVGSHRYKRFNEGSSYELLESTELISLEERR